MKISEFNDCVADLSDLFTKVSWPKRIKLVIYLPVVLFIHLLAKLLIRIADKIDDWAWDAQI